MNHPTQHRLEIAAQDLTTEELRRLIESEIAGREHRIHIQTCIRCTRVVSKLLGRDVLALTIEYRGAALEDGDG